MCIMHNLIKVDGKIMIKVERHKNLVRDPVSKAIINLDSAGAANYNKIKKESLARQAKIEEHCNEIECLKSDMDEIKAMLNRMLEIVSNTKIGEEA